MAPEQAMGAEIGPYTDLYAVGIIAFELLSGRPPFDSSGTPMAVLLRHVNEEPISLSAVRPSVDPRLSDWIAGLLARDPGDRTQTAWLGFEEIVLDRLGSRWRRAAALEPAAQGQPNVHVGVGRAGDHRARVREHERKLLEPVAPRHDHEPKRREHEQVRPSARQRATGDVCRDRRRRRDDQRVEHPS